MYISEDSSTVRTIVKEVLSKPEISTIASIQDIHHYPRGVSLCIAGVLKKQFLVPPTEGRAGSINQNLNYSNLVCNRYIINGYRKLDLKLY